MALRVFLARHGDSIACRMCEIERKVRELEQNKRMLSLSPDFATHFGMSRIDTWNSKKRNRTMISHFRVTLKTSIRIKR